MSMLAKHLSAVAALKKKRTAKTVAPPQTNHIIRSVCFLTMVLSIYAITHYTVYFGLSGKEESHLSMRRFLSGGATDDAAAHADDGHAFSLFGGISGLGIYIGTISVIIIVGAVQMVEYMFHLLHKITHDTPFHQMVNGIENELMVVGFTAFVFKIMVDTTHFLSLEWFHGLEYADILVPIFSFAYCGLGMMLILNSIQISTVWSQAYHLGLSEMLVTYYSMPGFVGYFPYGVILAPFTPTIARMEFRIFQSIFCQTYKIQKNAFAFNEYVEKVFEKFILTIIEIRPVDWFMMCTLVLLNWARNTLKIDYMSCGPHEVECEEENARIMYTVAGAIIFLMTLLLAVESRRLEVRIMAQKGIHSVHAYPAYLKYMEESAEAKALDAFRLNKDELKSSAEGVKYNAMQGDIDLEEEEAETNLFGKFKNAIPGLGGGNAEGGTAAHGAKQPGNNNKNANKFSASVKQAWKSKKNTNKARRRSVTTAGEARLGARRQSLMGGGLIGLGGESESAIKLRNFLLLRGASPQGPDRKVGAIAEGDEASSSSSSSSSSSGSGSDSGSEEFDVNARKRHKSTAPGAHDSKSSSKPHSGANSHEGEVADTNDESYENQGNAGRDDKSDDDGSDHDESDDKAGATAGPYGAAAVEGDSSGSRTQSTAALSPVPDRNVLSGVNLAPIATVAGGRPMPAIDRKLWKAAPYKSTTVAHVFTKMQKQIEAMMHDGSEAPLKTAHNKPGHHQGLHGLRQGGWGGPDPQEEDSKVSWGEAAQLKQKLPPLAQSSGKQGHIFGRTISKFSIHSDDQAAESPMSTTNSGTNTAAAALTTATSTVTASAVNLEGLSSRTYDPNAPSSLLKTKLPPIKPSQPQELPKLNAEALLKARISPARPVSRKTGSPIAKIDTALGGAIAGTAAAPSDNSLKFSDLAAEQTEKKHKESLVPPPIGSLRYTPTRSTGGRGFGDDAPGAQTPSEKAPTFTTPFPIMRLSNTPDPVTGAHPAPTRLSGISMGGNGPSGEEEEETPIVDVFILSWPELYLECVQSLIMIIALYYALFFTNFMAAAGSPAFKFLAIVPALISSVLLIYIVKCAVMLGAIHAVDCDAILEVLEQTEGAAVLSALIKEKVIALLQEMGPEPYSQLVNLFAQIDADGSGNISRDEFAEYMNSIEIHFDRRRWMQVFRGIDTTFDNKITFEEFFVFLFPDHEFGKGLKEKKNLTLQASLLIKSELRSEYLRRHKQAALMTYVPRKTVADTEPANPARTAAN